VRVDVSKAHCGLVFALVLTGAAQSARAADPAAGAGLFEDRCVTCHVARGGGQGPSLVTVFGRKAGSAPGFRYSAALSGSGLTWTAGALDRFLAGPSKMVPGTAMQVVIANPAQRADLIAFLASQKR